MPERVEDPWYDADHEARRVRSRGEIKWQGEYAFVSEALVGELVGLAELDNGDHVVRFCGHDLGVIDRRGAFRRFAPPRTGLREPPERAANANLSTISRSKMSRISPVEHKPRQLAPLARAAPKQRRLFELGSARPPPLPPLYRPGTSWRPVRRHRGHFPDYEFGRGRDAISRDVGDGAEARVRGVCDG